MKPPPNSSSAGLFDYLKAIPQYILPHYVLCNLMHAFARIRVSWIKDPFIRWFVKHFQVEMSEAQTQDIEQFAHFNEFFTRPLIDSARPINQEPGSIICPVDGCFSQLGKIQEEQIFQAKGRSFQLIDLLAGDTQWAERFVNGEFATIYLSPKDYHRIHMPFSGTLTRMTYVPGRLFSVNPATTRAVPRLFARNERVVCYFESEQGPFALILVGALFVASMETVWHGIITPPHTHSIRTWDYSKSQQTADGSTQITLNSAQEMGRFNMGSTVILLFPENSIAWENSIEAQKKCQMGQKIATITS